MDAQTKEIDAWKELRKRLDKSYNYSDDWNKAIKLFEKRLNNRFFKPIEELITSPSIAKLKGEGFSILMIQCALIEALASFRTGKIFKYSGKTKNYEYSGSKDIFVNFLNSEKIFEGNFWQNDSKGKKQKNTPFNAKDFYEQVRCGLMHEARTKGDWLVNAKPYDDGMKGEKIFITQNGSQISVLRTILHYRLKECVSNYCFDLKKPVSNELRRLFARKLDSLYDLPPDNSDWWVDR